MWAGAERPSSAGEARSLAPAPAGLGAGPESAALREAMVRERRRQQAARVYYGGGGAAAAYDDDLLDDEEEGDDDDEFEDDEFEDDDLMVEAQTVRWV